MPYEIGEWAFPQMVCACWLVTQLTWSTHGTTWLLAFLLSFQIFLQILPKEQPGRGVGDPLPGFHLPSTICWAGLSGDDGSHHPWEPRTERAEHWVSIQSCHQHEGARAWRNRSTSWWTRSWSEKTRGCKGCTEANTLKCWTLYIEINRSDKFNPRNIIRDGGSTAYTLFTVYTACKQCFLCFHNVESRFLLHCLKCFGLKRLLCHYKGCLKKGY